MCCLNRNHPSEKLIFSICSHFPQWPSFGVEQHFSKLCQISWASPSEDINRNCKTACEMGCQSTRQYPTWHAWFWCQPSQQRHFTCCGSHPKSSPWGRQSCFPSMHSPPLQPPENRSTKCQLGIGSRLCSYDCCGKNGFRIECWRCCNAS